MSLDLYQDETLAKISRLSPTDTPEPSMWDGFARGTALATMQGLAKTGRAIDLLGSVGPIVQDAVTGGTTAQDKYFSEHDDVFGSAVKFWTPDPMTVGKAGQVAGGLIGTLLPVVASPALSPAATFAQTGEDLSNEGVDITRTNLASGIQAAAMGLGVWLPILGSNAWQRIALGGVGLNAGLGIASRAATGGVLKGTEAEKDFEAFDPASLTLDVLLGAAFGVHAHFSPEMRAAGADFQKSMADWARNLKPSDIDALSTLRQAQHLNADAMPGKPVAPKDIEARVEELKATIEALERNEVPATSDMPHGEFTPDPVKEQGRADTLEALVQAADEARAVEGHIEPTAPDYLRVPDELRDTYRDLGSLPREEQAAGVRDVVEAQLRKAGVPEDEAIANAAIWGAFAHATGERYGINPAEVLTRYGLSVERGADRIAGALEQNGGQGEAGLGRMGHGKETQGAGETGRDLDFTGTQDGTGKELRPTVSGGHAEPGWAEATRIRGSDGEPTAVYRGASQPLAADHFAAEQLGHASGNPSAGLGVWFSTDKTEAAGYGHVEQFNLDLRNPKVIRVEDLPGFDSPAQARAYADSLKAQGHDGIIVTAKHLGGRVHAVAFDPKSVIKGEGAPSTLYQKAAEPFYSELARQVDAADMKAGSANSWKQWIKSLGSKGVKADEIKWSGLEEWLELQTGKIPKEAVQEFLRNNGVKVSEVMTGGRDAPNAMNLHNMDRDELLQHYEDITGQRQALLDIAPNATEDEIREQIENHYENAPGERETKFSAYQLPGGENYRELLLTLPNKTTDMAWWGQPVNGERRFFDDPGAASEYAGVNGQGGRVSGNQDAHGFQSSHFDQPNILAHVRFNERVDAEGKKTLFVEEFQSDWAQQGRKKGFQQPDAPITDADREQARETFGIRTRSELGQYEHVPQGVIPWEDMPLSTRDSYVQEMRAARAKTAIPAAPFVGKTDAWVALTLKRMIRYAAENGFDKVAWANGEQQVSRYSNALRKAVDSIEWEKTEQGIRIVGYKGKKPEGNLEARRDAAHQRLVEIDRQMDELTAAAHQGGVRPFTALEDETYARLVGERHLQSTSYFDLSRRAGKDDRTKVVDTTEKEDALSDSIGKAMAERIISDPNQKGTIEGEDIKVSDTGMAGFYDRIVPKIANEVLKKLGGGKVGEVKLGKGAKGDLVRAEIVDAAEEYIVGNLTPEEFLENSGLEGIMTVAEVENNFHLAQRDHGLARTSARDFAGEAMERNKGQMRSTQQGFEVSPAMREKAMAGQPLFQQSRGQINFGDERTIINLFQEANPSTFLHESGHFFLQVTKDLATAPNSPIGALNDWHTIKTELGLTDDTITREAHEQFARSFEAYLREGKAPTPELKGVFQQFRDWLVEIYHSIADLNVKLSDELRGVMDRMLKSQERDPAPAPRSAPTEQADGAREPPPPVPSSEPPAGAGPHKALTFDDPLMRSQVEAMAKHESGWLTIGGRLDVGRLREVAPENVNEHGEADKLGVPAFTEWTPKADWWRERPYKINEAKVQEAVRKAIAGEPLKKSEQATVDYLVKVANERMKASGIDPEERPMLAQDLIDNDEPATHQNIEDADVVARAVEKDPEAVERAAIEHENDDAAFMNEARSIANGHAAEKARQDRQADEQAPEGSSEGTEQTGDPQARLLNAEADRIVAEAPDRQITTGTNADGTPQRMSVKDYLEQERAVAAQAREDIKLLEIAATCWAGRM